MSDYIAFIIRARASKVHWRGAWGPSSRSIISVEEAQVTLGMQEGTGGTTHPPTEVSSNFNKRSLFRTTQVKPARAQACTSDSLIWCHGTSEKIPSIGGVLRTCERVQCITRTTPIRNSKGNSISSGGDDQDAWRSL